MPATYGLVGEYDEDPYEARYEQASVVGDTHYGTQNTGTVDPYARLSQGQYPVNQPSQAEEQQLQPQQPQHYQQTQGSAYDTSMYGSLDPGSQYQESQYGSSEYVGSTANISSGYTDPSSAARDEQLSPEYFDISPLLNYQDPVTIHFMVQSAIVDAKGIRILSYRELQDLKNEANLLASRLHDLDHKLEMETKLRDAAANLSKLHLQRSPSQKSNGNASSQGRRSFLKIATQAVTSPNNGEMSNKDRKRLSKHAEEELDIANRRISNYNTEHAKLYERYNELNTRIMHHNIGILAYAQSSQLQKASSSPNAATTSNAVRATTRMKQHYRTSNVPAGTHSTSASISDEGGKLDQLISLLSRSVTSSTVSPRPPSANDSSNDKIDYLRHLCTNLINRSDSDQEEKNHLISIIQEALNELDPGVEPDRATLREQLIEAVFRLKDAYSKSREAAEMPLRGSSRSIDLADDSTAADSHSPNTGGALLKKRLESLMVSYETNSQELERLEIENVDLRNSLNEAKFERQAHVQQLESELKVSDERVQEWKERCEGLQAELESVVKSLEDVTRQAVDYETERVKLESRVNELEQDLFKESQNTLGKRVSMISAPNSPMKLQNQKGLKDGSPDSFFNGISGDGEQLSVPILRHEFRKIVMEINAKHAKDLKKEQTEKKRLESLLRSIKRSSYAATIPQSKLDALEASLDQSEQK